MASELKSIIQNDTWELAERPKDREVIGSRIISRLTNLLARTYAYTDYCSHRIYL